MVRSYAKCCTKVTSLKPNNNPRAMVDEINDTMRSKRGAEHMDDHQCADTLNENTDLHDTMDVAAIEKETETELGANSLVLRKSSKICPSI